MCLPLALNWRPQTTEDWPREANLRQEGDRSLGKLDLKCKQLSSQTEMVAENLIWIYLISEAGLHPRQKGSCKTLAWFEGRALSKSSKSAVEPSHLVIHNFSLLFLRLWSSVGALGKRAAKNFSSWGTASKVIQKQRWWLTNNHKHMFYSHILYVAH